MDNIPRPLGTLNLPLPETQPLSEHDGTFRSLVEGAKDIISVWGLDGVLTYLSPGVKTLLGYDVKEWLGHPFASLVHPDDLSVCLEANQQVALSGESQSGIEFRNRHKAGHWVWTSANINPVKDEKGHVIAFNGILRDIDKAKRQESALRFIVEGTLAKTGDDFFRSCVKNLAEICQVQYAFITELVDDTCRETRMLSLWTGETFVEAYNFELAGTPCQVVFQENWGIFAEALQDRFPAASSLATLGAESYLGVAIPDAQGNALGNLGIIDTKPLSSDLTTPKFILQLFAARIGAELKRTAAEATLREYADRQTVLNQLANQIRNSLDLEDVISTALQSIRSLLAVDYCAFAWYAPTAAPPTWHIIQESKGDDIPSRLGDYPETIIGPVGDSVLSQKTLRIDDVDQYHEPIHQAFLAQIQGKSEILLPIRTHADRIGVMICIHHDQVRPWSESEVSLLESVRTQLAIGIDQAELYAASRSTNEILKQTLEELKQTQAQMLHSEKMSGLGQLVAGIAHEINNPVNFIHANISPARDYTHDLLALIALYQQAYPHPVPEIPEKIEEIDLDFLRKDLPLLLSSMEIGTERIQEIVKSLRLFSRLDEADVKPVDIHDGLNSTLMILQHRIKAQSDRAEIKIIKDFGDLPLVECFAGQLNQVFMNILANAIYALEDRDRQRTYQAQQQNPSTLEITTAVTGNGHVTISIKDNGPGIPESIKQQIFDPFFTTKPIGQGTGMGLAISYQIVTEKHGGQLRCLTLPAQGTEFILEIPVKPLPR